MEEYKKLNSKRLVTIFLIFLGLVLIWSIAGAAVWSGQIKKMPIGVVRLPISLTIALTTWPAHQALLEISGKGFGANANSEFNFLSLALFFIWASILWSPILIFLKRNITYRVAIIIQLGLLVAVSVLFWKFGNG